MSKNVIVIGGGIIGLCSAYYLHKEGHKVAIIDQSNMDGGASYVNAGYLSPSHIVPLSAPGVMKKGLKWMFNPASPLYIKPRLDSDFIKWVKAFNQSCNSNHVKKAIPAIKRISLLSQELYDDIKQSEKFSFHYEKKGLLMLCQTDKMLEEEIKTAQLAKTEGLDVSEISLEELKVLEPKVDLNVSGAVYYKCDSHTTPHEFMAEMKAYLKNAGIQFFFNEKVEDFEISNGKIISVKTHNQILKADEFVLAAGSWSHHLSKRLGLKLLLQAGKGYRINTEQPTGIQIPSILAEAKVAVTPMNGFTRFAGTMEIAGINHHINKIRVEAIANAASRYYPDIRLSEDEKNAAACGLRPVTPDGLPYIGKSSRCENLTIAAGHAMMGWSMGTGTGKLVAEIISKKMPSMSLEMFNPDRKF
ncbi:FAD-dependent oxidoreductase [Subsaxibacter sp. CAU 1640]|uniref:NAD(P)/FAD-dependent oxidoreductase n=1 Tax=Subsaxibacter sp. CAU 1640 TaxID=2933271 RepID=UPI002006A95D|nr:FAD-dependent oxidoreductase [Subsaxibacter sp. CAU 1640]MCK7589106.1 FAD-dependent oxidoreductase [Subsaxibacter sp. CAU 1640]